jgi:hypothetical protein
VIFKSPNREITLIYKVEIVTTRRLSSSNNIDSLIKENQSKASFSKASFASPAKSSSALASISNLDNKRRILYSKLAQLTTTTNL